MTARVIKRFGNLSLVAGLNWTPMLQSTARGLSAEVRRVANEGDARKILLFKRNSLTSLGLYVADDSGVADELDDQGGKGLFSRSREHSLAAVVANLAGDGNAILAYRVGNGEMAVVVVVESGIPTIDEIKPIEEAQAITLRYASGGTGFVYAVFTNDMGTFGGADHTNLIADEALFALADKTTLLVGKPINVVAVALGLLVLVAAVAGYFAYADYASKRARLEAVKRAAAADPAPRYEAALVAGLANMGPTRQSLQNLLQMMQQYPVSQGGWLLTGITCASATAQCASSWLRESGTTQDLASARKEFGEQLEIEDSLLRVRLIRQVRLDNAGMPAGAITGGAEAAIALDSLLQRWSNAGLEVSYSRAAAQPWPAAPGVELSALRPGLLVSRSPVSVIAPLHLAQEVLSQTPERLWWSDLSTSVDLAKGEVLVTFKGFVYGRQ